MELLDESIFKYEFDKKAIKSPNNPDIPKQIRHLLEQERFGVLCTQAESQPYGSIIAFAHTEDLRAFYFTTSISTRKYRLLNECDRVALTIDSRSQHPEDMTKIEAITVTGKAIRLLSGERYETGLELLKKRHIYLHHFFEAESTSLFRIDVIRYFHVTRFQEVSQWIP